MVHMQPSALPDCCAPPTGPPAQCVFESSIEAPRKARRYVREVMAKDDPPLDDDRLDALLLMVSEVTTNAYRYGTEPGDSMLVKVLPLLTHVRVEVHDTSRKRPEIRAESGERARGRGLHIIEAMAARWGVYDREFGKVVWLEVER
ncbi:ATP-binding protein [Streptomyces sp. NPDC088254]|uniref:ATP-binding protein n=1 Tax=Streptomyces sp. NPDC088254 TaxID=3365847 RepID=UPI0037F73A48